VTAPPPSWIEALDGFLPEARVQLRGEAGSRQIPKDVEIAAVGIGGGPEAGCLLLRRDR
jgi:hypothetical protein